MAEKIEVRIFGSRYVLRDVGDGEYLRKLAKYVDTRMNELAVKRGNVSALRLAVLTALNISDDLFREQEKKEKLGEIDREIEARTRNLVELLDRGIGETERSA